MTKEQDLRRMEMIQRILAHGLVGRRAWKAREYYDKRLQRYVVEFVNTW